MKRTLFNEDWEKLAERKGLELQCRAVNLIKRVSPLNMRQFIMDTNLHPTYNSGSTIQKRDSFGAGNMTYTLESSRRVNAFSSVTS